MSWDVSVAKFQGRYSRVSDIPSTAVTLSLGARVDVEAAIAGFFPETDWTNPTWGVYQSDAGSIEFNMKTDDPVDGFMMHVRGDDEIAQRIAGLCRQQGWSGIDCGTGDFIEQSMEPAAGMRQWRNFRDQALAAPLLLVRSDERKRMAGIFGSLLRWFR